MFKKLTILPAVFILMLASCSSPIDMEDEVVQDQDKKEDQKTSIVSSQLSDNDYRTILPYRPSASRGVITNQMGNRLDINEVETGLKRLSKDYFDPDDYFFEEGQYLTSDMLYSWLDTYPTDDELSEMKNNEDIDKADIKKQKKALNPPLDEETATKEDHKNNPKYLSHILEQDFLKRHDDDTVELVGVSIAIALKSVYRFKVDGKPDEVKISKKDMLDKGKEIAQTVLERVRNIDELSDVPIMIALYREEDETAPVAGNFVAKTSVKGTSSTINNWTSINEENVLFPSSKGDDKDHDTQQLIENFSERVEEYFPEYVGVVGDGFYIDGELQKLTLELPLEFFSQEEVVGFTQYVSELVEEMFEDYYDLEIQIKSEDQMESFVHREAGDSDVHVHILN